MQRDHARLHRSLAVLGPPRRFQLMLLLLSGVERSVSQLARAVRLSQSCTTRHLQALEEAGLVKGTRDGKRVVFRPAPRDATARGVLASLARNAEDGVLAAGIAAGAIPIASAAELEPLMEAAPEPRPRPRPRAERVRRVRLRPPREEWGEPAPAEVGEVAAPGRPEAIASDVAGAPVLRRFDDAFEPEFEHVFTPGPALASRDEPESGNRAESHEPAPRRSSDIEDFLL